MFGWFAATPPVPNRRTRLFCRIWPTFWTRAALVRSPRRSCEWHFVRPLFNISALFESKRLGELDAFSIEWPGVAGKHGIERELVFGRARGRQPGGRREDFLYLLWLPRHQ